MTFLNPIWDALSRVPHCLYYGDPWITAFHIGPYLGIWLAYLTIPICMEIVRFQRGTAYSWLVMLFEAFILLCGTGHAVDAIAMTQGSKAWLWAANGVHTLTAVVSLGTAICVIKMIPVLKKLPTPEQHEDVVRTLEENRNWVRAKELGWPPPAEQKAA